MGYRPPGVKIQPIEPAQAPVPFIPEFRPRMVLIGKTIPSKIKQFEEGIFSGSGYYELEITGKGLNLEQIIEVRNSLGLVYDTYPIDVSWYWTSPPSKRLTTFYDHDGNYDNEAKGTWSATSGSPDLTWGSDGGAYYLQVGNIDAGATVAVKLTFDEAQNWKPFQINPDRDIAAVIGGLQIGFAPSVNLSDYDVTITLHSVVGTASVSLDETSDFSFIPFASFSGISFDILASITGIEISITNNTSSDDQYVRLTVMSVLRTDDNANKLVWFTGATDVPASGASYYVTYKYQRPASDYTTVKTYNSWEDAHRDLGDPSGDNELALATYYVFNTVGLEQVNVVMAPDNSGSSMINGWNVAYEKDFDYVVLLGDITGQEGTLRSLVVKAFDPDEKKERYVFVGHAEFDSSVSDNDKINQMRTSASTLGSKYILMVSPDKAYYTYEFTPLFESASTRVTVKVPGYFLALGVAALKASYEDPSQPLIRKIVPGFTLDLDDPIWFNDSVMNSLAEAGITVICPTDIGTNIPMVREDVTTDPSTIYSFSFAVNDITMFVTKKARKFLDKNFIGRKVINRTAMLSSIQAALRNYLTRTFVSRGIISAIDSINVSIAADDPRKIVVWWRLQYPTVVRTIEGSFTYYL